MLFRSEAKEDIRQLAKLLDKSADCRKAERGSSARKPPTAAAALLDSAGLENPSPDSLARATLASNPFTKPRYFEEQVGAHCGLHALNNVCGSCTGLQTFTIEDVIDGLRTLQEEHARDDMVWDVRAHVSASGDYSLTLLQWLLQRRLVKHPAAQQYAASNLRDRCTDLELTAQDLLGGIVHIPAERDPTHGHWVSFARQDLPGTFWWMDSRDGFEQCDTAALQAQLHGRNFVRLLACSWFPERVMCVCLFCDAC